jgi:hypothetical protein
MTQAELIQIEGEMRSAKVVRIILLLCGVVSSLAYIGADIAAAMSWDSYSYINQSISELFAIGSPVKWIFALIPYSPLVIAFGLGVWWSAGARCVSAGFCWLAMALFPRQDPISPCTCEEPPAPSQTSCTSS